MNRIYWVRHGENRANLTLEFSHRRVDYSLTPKGILQAQQTAEFLRDQDIDEVYSSPLRRASETAHIIAAPLDLPMVILEELREIDVGELEDHPPTAEAWALHNRIIQDWLSGKPEATFPGGENYHSVWMRLRAALVKMTANREGCNIVV